MLLFQFTPYFSMTVIDAYQLLNEHFNTNTVFSLKKNKTEVIVISDDEDGENAALLCALVEMEKGGILRSSEIGGEKYWVLYKALESFSQTLQISAFVAAGIASVINNICDKLGTDSEKCDPSDVSEKDLKNLIYMASKVSAENLKK